MKYIALAFLACFATACSNDDSLPSGYRLTEDAQGGYAILDSRGVEKISGGVVSIGYNESFIVACKVQPGPYVDPKRMVFIALKSGVAVDSVNATNWAYFIGRFPDLGKVRLRKLTDATCP